MSSDKYLYVGKFACKCGSWVSCCLCSECVFAGVTIFRFLLLVALRHNLPLGSRCMCSCPFQLGCAVTDALTQVPIKLL